MADKQVKKAADAVASKVSKVGRDLAEQMKAVDYKEVAKKVGNKVSTAASTVKNSTQNVTKKVGKEKY